eukprot:CAMPEP_0181327690 /NCGR_PEP_ID=MMETSP1101-20121128/22255_1 /TAXON_ID=46948 /ORGANISM="Rhodomonas abbreviata, Strain Caron Lab Isolate" /LENGTH=124 /DNA_ID=CAMNT_0023436405 /DNA_START=266 /DNA_END=636 /DNA_ORIENTATION=-
MPNAACSPWNNALTGGMQPHTSPTSTAADPGLRKAPATEAIDLARAMSSAGIVGCSFAFRFVVDGSVFVGGEEADAFRSRSVSGISDGRFSPSRMESAFVPSRMFGSGDGLSVLSVSALLDPFP